MRMALILISLVFGLGIAQAADVRTKAQPAPAAQASSWSCGGWTRFSKGLLYDTPGFFGTKEWSNTTLVGCSQPNGGWDWDIVALVPLRGDTASEFDGEGGYTFVHSREAFAPGKTRLKWWTRVGLAYWNVEAVPGSRFQIFDARIQTNYLLGTWQGVSTVVWVRLDNQVIRAPIPVERDHDINLGIGANFSVALGSWAALLVEGAYYRHLKSFGPAQDVFAVTGEIPFNTGTYAGFKTTVGPWGRATWGTILGAPGNRDFNHSIGFKASAFN